LHEVLDRNSMLELLLLLLRCRRLLLMPLHLLHERLLLLLLLLLSLVFLAHGTQGVATRAQHSAGYQAIGITTSLLLGVGARAFQQLLELGIHLLLLLPREGMLQGHQHALVGCFLRNAWLMVQTYRQRRAC
jgi:uncharacterized membrane protein YphA (DoxX/SURF4 family)